MKGMESQNYTQIKIELIGDGDTKNPWCQVIDDKTSTLIGIYEDGKVARQLFLLDRKQLKQLLEVLSMIYYKR